MVGITLDSERAGGWSNYPWYAVRQNYCDAVREAGGLPVLLPHARGALARDLPLLGICGGQQLLNVVLGGTLIQHIPDEVEGALVHEQPNPRHEAGHPVALAGDGLLRSICGSSEMAVNSAHHQAVKAVGPGVVVNAVAPDGVVEGIEAPHYRFCLGVQWHPEYAVSPSDSAIFRAFVATAA